MKRTPFVAAVLLATSILPPSQSAEIYVSPQGNDAHVGTKAKPLASLTAAQERASSAKDDTVTVYLQGGTYYLSRPLVFAPADSRKANAPLATLYARAIKQGRVTLTLWRNQRNAPPSSTSPRNAMIDFRESLTYPACRYAHDCQVITPSFSNCETHHVKPH
jgi:hypothetical protein